MNDPMATDSEEDESNFECSSSTPAAMTEEVQKERRASIKAIMSDPSLTPAERRKSIQSLMDGRRRSSCGGRTFSGAPSQMAAAAAAAAAAFADSDSSDDNSVASTPHANNHSGQQQPPRTSMGSHQRFVRSNSLRSSFTLGFSNLNTGAERAASDHDDDDDVEEEDDESSGDDFADVCSALPGGGIAYHYLNGAPIGNPRKMERARPHCDHYVRKCSIISPCCGVVFGCRICHDDCTVLPPPLFINPQGGPALTAALATTAMDNSATNLKNDTGTSDIAFGSTTHTHTDTKRSKASRSASLPTRFQEEEAHHDIDRFQIREVICRQCYTRQGSKTNTCIKCNIKFSEYHCNICNLWMSADEEPYHCHDCGFCRVGGRGNFRHCHDCGMCIDSLLFGDHNCKTGKYMSNCPVCQEDLFSSRSASHEMPCGHAIHWHCFRELTSFDTRCPVCKKTAETHEQMAPTWSAMAMGIALQPVPPDLARVVTIACNDCEEKDKNRRWHFLGVQCMNCKSFNTTVEKTQLVGQEAVEFLGDDNEGESARMAFTAAGGSVTQDVLAAMAAASASAEHENTTTTAQNGFESNRINDFGFRNIRAARSARYYHAEGDDDGMGDDSAAESADMIMDSPIPPTAAQPPNVPPPAAYRDFLWERR